MLDRLCATPATPQLGFDRCSECSQCCLHTGKVHDGDREPKPGGEIPDHKARLMPEDGPAQPPPFPEQQIALCRQKPASCPQFSGCSFQRCRTVALVVKPVGQIFNQTQWLRHRARAGEPPEGEHRPPAAFPAPAEGAAFRNLAARLLAAFHLPLSRRGRSALAGTYCSCFVHGVVDTFGTINRFAAETAGVDTVRAGAPGATPTEIVVCP